MKKNDFDAYVEIKFLMENPFKLRKVADVIRGKNVETSLQILNTLPQKT